MPITNRAKTAVNTVVKNVSVPTMNQQATMTARGQIPNQTPHEGRPDSKGGVNVFQGMVQAVNTAAPVVGTALKTAGAVNEFNRAQGIGKVAAAAKIAGGTAATISRGASAISGLTTKLGTTLIGRDSTRQDPVSAIKQVPANIPGIVKFTNPASVIGGQSNDILSLGGMSNMGNPLTSLQLMSGGAILEDILLTHGKKTENAEIKYRIIFQFEGKDKTKYDDVLLFSVHRYGFVNSSAKATAKINLPPVLVAQLKQQQAMNKVFKVNVKIYQVDTENKNKLKNLILERNFVGRSIEEKTDPSIEKGNSTTCTMGLFNPSLYEMDLKYTFNKIENAKTPYEVLQDFEGHITSTYGDNFESRHILGKKNEHKYEQIVTQPTDQEIKLPNRKEFKFMCKHDADIPLFLNYKYKIDNTLSFYFFDDFDLKSKKAVTRLFIALYDKNKFEKFKISNQQDIIRQTQLTGTYPFADVDGLLTPGNTVASSKLINGQYDTKKEQSGSSVKGETQVTGEASSSKGDPTRKFNAQKTTETQHQIPTKTGQSINQVPDSDAANAQRSEAANKTFSEKIAQVDSFLTKNCGFDFVRFGVIYPMNEKRPNEYLHTPISIMNVFRRDNDKETVLSHSVRFLMVKFGADAQSESDTKSDSSNKGSNENRDATQKAQNADPKKEKPQSTNPPTSKGSARQGDSPASVPKGSSGGGAVTPPKQTPAPPSPSGGAVPGPVSNNPAKTRTPEVNLMTVEEAEDTMDDWG